MIKSSVCVILLWCYCLKTCDSQLKNNVCKNFEDFVNMNNSENCWYNPDMFATPENIARRYGFQFQTHKIETEDGYFLTLFRIQDKFSSAKKQPILIHHGALSSATCFITQGNKSLAFYLAKNGYDVWLANYRGNSYSIGHSKLSTSDPKYWDFSFHEIGLYDLPAEIEYITRKTGNFSKIIYIGHSLGTTACFIYASLRSDHAQNYLKGFIALSPATSAKYIPLPFWKTFTRPLYRFAQDLMDNNVTVLFPNPEEASRMLTSMCQKNIAFCLRWIYFFNGKDDGEFIPEYLMVMISHHPARIAIKILSHLAQLVLAGKFQQYDYGATENYQRYNSTEPAIYHLENITIPVHLFYGLNDNLVSERDAYWALTQLKTKEKSMIQIPESGSVRYNHMNFVLSKHIEAYFYKPLIRVIKHLQKTN